MQNICRFYGEREFDENLTAKVHYSYMDKVTRCGKRLFPADRRLAVTNTVSNTGHLIEDNNQHARCGSSLGHYFRGLAGQDMSGIDDIGGQVLPQGEDITYVSHWDTA